MARRHAAGQGAQLGLQALAQVAGGQAGRVAVQQALTDRFHCLHGHTKTG
ncbi:hypothetical protein XPU_3941, partial [Xanthomonas arboricola pv. pruni str. MAFF 311562]